MEALNWGGGRVRGGRVQRGIGASVTLVASLWAGLASPAGPLAAQEPTRPVAFAISGGASKGAYEAGINWAVLTTLRDGVSDDPVLRGEFRRFELASVAGASAGGINSLITGLIWCSRPETDGGVPNRIDDNLFRSVWFLPDVNRLLPPAADSPLYRPDDALLSRADLLEASHILRVAWNTPHFEPGCRVPLGVTVTRVFPEVLRVGDIEVKNQRFSIPFELRVQPDRTVGFYFDPADYPASGDYSMILLPQRPEGPRFGIEDARIEEAVLTTSAFPMAFGRKRLQYCRLTGSYGETQEAAAQAAAESGLCPHGYELAQAEFADGGLFDNLPIGLARALAERSVRRQGQRVPVLYYYLDPDRLRYAVPEVVESEACRGPDPSPACRVLEYSLGSESHLLLDAYGTARKYELYREITSADWQLNLADLSYQVADRLDEAGWWRECDAQLPLFGEELSCADALRHAGHLLEVTYARAVVPVTPPFSEERLRAAGVVQRCDRSQAAAGLPVLAECRIDPGDYRRYLGERLLAILERSPVEARDLLSRVRAAQLAPRADRSIRVSSRGAPITGTLIGDFGAFLDLKFREYDYYVGIYDAVVLLAETVCRQHYSPLRQSESFGRCRDSAAQTLHGGLGIAGDPRARYVFARLAEREFAASGALAFAYRPLPAEQRDLRIIYEGLEAALAEQWRGVASGRLRAVERDFFRHLEAAGFEPTPSADAGPPLLAEIMRDPALWPSELTRRFTERMVLLEQQAEAIQAAREPDPRKRPDSATTVLGATSYVLRSMTYRHPEFAFSPSTAPRGWGWRYVIPYEAALDFAEGDFLLTWQPTWRLSRRNTLGLRAGFGFAEGLLGGGSEGGRRNFVSAGLDLTRHTGGGLFSSWGVAPLYRWQVEEPDTGERGSLGADLHVGVLGNRLRIGVGTYDLEAAEDEWFFTLGITDLPGLAYWLTR